MDYSSNGYPVCPADEVMRRNEGNLTREEYTEMMGFKKPEDDNGWVPVARMFVVALVVMVVVALLSGCATGMTMEERREMGRDFCSDQTNQEKQEDIRKTMDDYVIEGFGPPSPQMFFFMGLACAKSEMV